MFNSVIKEIGIIILLLIAITLILVNILYAYHPSQKTIPNQVDKYELPAHIESELSKSVAKEPQNIVKTYKIEEEDLNSYEKTNEYDRGKINPFKFSATDTITNSNVVAGVNETTGLLNTQGK